MHLQESRAANKLSQGNMEWFLQHPIIQWEAGILLVKNLAHRFVASNVQFQTYSGVLAKHLVGLCDEDMPWAESKDIYINHEKYILRGLDYSVIEPLKGKVSVNLLGLTQNGILTSTYSAIDKFLIKI